MNKDAAKMQIDKTEKSETVSMSVDCPTSHSFPKRLGRAGFQRDYLSTFK